MLHTPDLARFRAEKQVRNARSAGCCHTPLRESRAMTDLPIVFVVIVFVVGIAAGGLGVHLLRLRARSRHADHEPSDDGFAGLSEATAALNGQVTSIHSLVTDLLREQTTAGERLAVVGQQSAALHMTLASHQRRGAWGEHILADVLTWAGLQRGVNYRTQHTLANGARPDFSFFMADGRELHVDAKFPVEQAETDEISGRECVVSLRRHIKAVAGRGYSDPTATVGFVVLFVANPAVLGAAVEADPDLIKHALSQQVVLADAQTLMAILMLVKSAADALRVQRRTGDILRIIQEFEAEWEKFTAHLDKTDKQLTTVLRSWENLNTTRRRQLQRRMDRIDRLDAGDEPASIASDTSAAALPDSGTSDRAEAAQPCANGSASSQRPHRSPVAAATSPLRVLR